MKKVLFTVDDIYPRKDAFSQTLLFCEKMKAEMLVLQVINPVHFTCRGLRFVKLRLKWMHRYMEDSLAAGTLAEAGASNLALQYLREGEKQLQKLLPESEKAGIHARAVQKVGFADAEIRKCLDSDMGIFLTFYDPGVEQKRWKKGTKLNFLNKESILDTGVPLVVLH